MGDQQFRQGSIVVEARKLESKRDSTRVPFRLNRSSSVLERAAACRHLLGRSFHSSDDHECNSPLSACSLADWRMHPRRGRLSRFMSTYVLRADGQPLSRLHPIQRQLNSQFRPLQASRKDYGSRPERACCICIRAITRAYERVNL